MSNLDNVLTCLPTKPVDNPRNEAVCLLTMDFSKAFDNVNHHFWMKNVKKNAESTYGFPSDRRQTRLLISAYDPQSSNGQRRNGNLYLQHWLKLYTKVLILVWLLPFLLLISQSIRITISINEQTVSFLISTMCGLLALIICWNVNVSRDLDTPHTFS